SGYTYTPSKMLRGQAGLPGVPDPIGFERRSLRHRQTAHSSRLRKCDAAAEEVDAYGKAVNGLMDRAHFQPRRRRCMIYLSSGAKVAWRSAKSSWRSDDGTRPVLSFVLGRIEGSNALWLLPPSHD